MILPNGFFRLPFGLLGPSLPGPRSCASIKKDRDFVQGALPGAVSIKKDRDFAQ